MKKKLIGVLVVFLLVSLLITFLTGGFTKGVLSGKIYRPQNVYEEIWNLVLLEQHTRNNTVLTSSTKDAEVDFDFGVDFVGIHIPECNVTLCWRSEGEELLFLFQIGHGEYTSFIYNYESKILFADADFSYIMENFLTDYFEWCKVDPDFSSGYSVESLGDFAFQYVNPIWERKVTS